MIWKIKVGFTTQYPIVPDEYSAYVLVEAPDKLEAQLVATYMTMKWPHCMMVTRTTIL